MVKISATHNVTSKGVVRRNPPTTQIGDGKLPNAYWVSASNNFYICENGTCNWADEKLKFKVTGKTIAKFKTFAEALNYIDSHSTVSEEPTEDKYNSYFIEDRLSGQIFEQAVYAYPKTKGMLKGGYRTEVENHTETAFTEKKMAEKGYQFR